MVNYNRKLDKETKILLLSVLKKGYFDKEDELKLSKYFVFGIPIDEWIKQNDNTEH